jgi:hypothetical protein
MGSTASGTAILIYPGLDYQYLIEGLVASIFIFMGFMGVVLMHQSTHHVYRPNYARLLLIMGIALVFASYIFMTSMLWQKFQTA